MAFRMRSIPLLKSLFGYQSGRTPRQINPEDGIPQDLLMSIDNYIAQFYAKQTELSTDRIGIYEEVAQLGTYGLISSALDLVAENATQLDLETNKSIWVESSNETIEMIANKLLDDLQTEDEIFAITRSMCLFGDDFSVIITSEKEDKTPGGICRIKGKEARKMTRHKDEIGRLKGFSYGDPSEGESTEKKAISNPWDYIHFRLLGSDRISKYGYSYVAPVRREHRRLQMMEDAMAIYRIKRSPDRFVFKVKGLDELSPEERVETFNKIKEAFRRRMMTDPETGQVKSELKTLNIDQDFFLDEDSLDIQKLPGSPVGPGQVLDVDYVRKRVLGILRIPPDYLGFSDSAGGFLAQSPLSNVDVNFARQLKRIQRAIIIGYTRLIQIHLAWMGIDPDIPTNDFVVHMTPCSFLDELQRAQLLQVRATAMGILVDIAKALQVEDKALLPYLIKISGLPASLFRTAEEEMPADAIAGAIDIVESKNGLKELDKRFMKLIDVVGRKNIENLTKDMVFQHTKSSKSMLAQKTEALPTPENLKKVEKK